MSWGVLLQCDVPVRLYQEPPGRHLWCLNHPNWFPSGQRSSGFTARLFEIERKSNNPVLNSFFWCLYTWLLFFLSLPTACDQRWKKTAKNKQRAMPFNWTLLQVITVTVTLAISCAPLPSLINENTIPRLHCFIFREHPTLFLERNTIHTVQQY